jgi:hypothetical protein
MIVRQMLKKIKQSWVILSPPRRTKDLLSFAPLSPSQEKEKADPSLRSGLPGQSVRKRAM